MVRQSAPGAPHAPSRRAIGIPALRRWFAPLPAPMRAGFAGQVDAGIAQLLPVLGLVLLAAPAHTEGRLRWTPGWRRAWLCMTHAGAMVICATVLGQGLALAHLQLRQRTWPNRPCCTPSATTTSAGRCRAPM